MNIHLTPIGGFRGLIFAAALCGFGPAGFAGEPERGLGEAPAEPAAALEGADRAKTRAQLLEEVAMSWQRPGVFATAAPDAETSATLPALERKLNDIVLPHVAFTGPEATLATVLDALGSLSEEYDSAGEPGINFVLVDPAGRNPLVRLTLRHGSLRRILDLLTEQIGYQYEVQADAVVVRPGDAAANLVTQFFPVTRATVLRLIGLAGASVAPAAEPLRRSDPGGMPGSTLAEAAALRAFFQQAGVSFESVPGASLAYDGAALIVTQTPRHTERVRAILARYHDVRQVEIEAKFMEVQEGALEELGVTWSLSRRGLPQIDPVTGAPVLDAYGRQVFTPQETYRTETVTRTLSEAFPSSANSNAITIREAAGAGTPGGRIDVPVAPTQVPGTVQLATGAAGLANISGFVGEFDVQAVVRALSQQQGTDLLSSPKITVLSGNPATITVAQELRYPQSYGEIQSQVGSGAATATGNVGSAGVTITAGTPQEFTTRNVGVELRVTPTVEEDNRSISLDLNPKVTEFEGFVEYGGPSIAISAGTTVTVPPGFYQPIFSVRDISTRVTIWDGATLVMGGLTREEVKKVNDKVPILGDIPLIGRLFRSEGESAQKRNLLIFVTANLVSPGGSPMWESLRSTAAGARFQNPTQVTPASAEPRAWP